VSRVVLNTLAPGAEARDDGRDAGEDLARAMLDAVGAHTTAAGRVDYGALRVSAELTRVEVTAARLVAFDLDRLRTRGERLAFWINLYNALALHGVVRLGLTRSVWQVWNFYGRVSYRVGGHVLSLDEIEHGILRANARRALPPWPPFGRRDPRRRLAVDPIDPRIHFALNCAAASCPPVGVYRAAVIESQLALAARNFVNQEVTLDAGRVRCSRIFKWYGGDFGSTERLADFLRTHLDEGPVKAALMADPRPCRSYRPYSWALPHPPA
jgi:hypothetical protein